MAGSVAERQIRDAAVTFLRSQLPGARIIHELVVGTCRADLAAVEPRRITLVEIKSERDTLTRLGRQGSRFGAASHDFVLIAHARWFEEFSYHSGSRGFRPTAELKAAQAGAIWRYPEPEPGQFAYHDRWLLPQRWTRPPQPHAAKLLGLLWRAELMAEADRHSIAVPRRATIAYLISEMAWLMTGREIAEAVCRQLRARPFPEADPAIIEVRAEAA